MAYGTNESYVLADWSFGWDISTSPLDLDKRALSDCKNFNLTTRRGLEKRRGMTRMFTPASAGVVSDVFEYKAPDGTAYVLVATDTKIRSYYSGGWNDLVAGRTPGVRHSFAVHQGFCYGVNGVDPNFKLYNGTSYGVGIAPPPAAPGVADGGAGSLTGKYSYVYCYKRSSPNPLISNPSPASTPLDLTSKIFTVTYTPSLDPQVDTIIVYRTLNLNTQGTDPLAFFKVAEFAQAATAGGPPTGYLVTHEGFQLQGSDIPTVTVDAGTEPPGDYILAASPELVDVEAAIALAVVGDLVVVPAGEATWAYQLVITKGITLMGAGVGNTVIYSATGTPAAIDTRMIRYNPTNPELNEPFRLSGFTFDGIGGGILRLSNSSALDRLTNIRVDHIAFENCQTLFMEIGRGNVFGVMDNCTFTGNPHIDMYGTTQNWYNFAFSFGSLYQFYIEDCTWTSVGNVINSTGIGGGVCFRHNLFSTTKNMFPLHDLHGNQPAGNSSGSVFECYGNTYILGGTGGSKFFDMRGGKSLIYDNVLIYAASPPYANYREEYNDALGVGPAVNAISGQPQHVSDSYSWNNLRNGSLLNPSIAETVDYGGGIGLVPQFDVDCFREVAGFNGSSGVGRGLLSARPATCTLIGAAYWATDVGALYRWESPGQWEDYYSPYTYPHPLRSDPEIGD
jgi:hypothetical protein